MSQLSGFCCIGLVAVLLYWKYLPVRARACSVWQGISQAKMEAEERPSSL